MFLTKLRGLTLKYLYQPLEKTLCQLPLTQFHLIKDCPRHERNQYKVKKDPQY